MALPSLLLGGLLSTLYGAIFHLWRGGGFFRLLFYILLGWIGFWCGHAFANAMHWTWDSLGSLHLGTASIGSFLLLGVGYWLSLVDRRGKS
jgi:uncharacterized membrane protein YeaQ/YmgE (transglycosylase-associated protein family)